MGRTKNFADAILARVAADPSLARAIETESFNADLAMKVYELRMAAGLTQKQLAERIGTKQSVISRIENADYNGRSLRVLKRIAYALGKSLRVEFYARSTPPTITVSEKFSWNWQPAPHWQPNICQQTGPFHIGIAGYARGGLPASMYAQGGLPASVVGCTIAHELTVR